MKLATGLNSRLLNLLSNFAIKYTYKKYYWQHNFKHIKDHSNIFVVPSIKNHYSREPPRFEEKNLVLKYKNLSYGSMNLILFWIEKSPVFTC